MIMSLDFWCHIWYDVLELECTLSGAPIDYHLCNTSLHSQMFPLMTLTALSVYGLFYYMVWFDCMSINVTFVYQFLAMDSDND